MQKKPLLSKKKIQYIEAVVYIIAIILVVFAKVYGPIYLNFIPLLVILGVVGNLVYKRGIITTVFGIVISLCMVHIKGNLNFFENILFSFFVGLDIAMGELLGEYINKSINLYNKNKERNIKENNKKRDYNIKKLLKEKYTYIILVFVLILTCFVNLYINGDIVSLNKAKESLNRYFNEEYDGEENFSIISTSYSIGFKRYYTFNVYNQTENHFSNFIIYLNDINTVIDEYKESIISKKNDNELLKLEKYLNSNNYNSKYLDLDIDINYLDTKNFEISLKKQVDTLDNYEKEMFAKEVASFLEDITNYEEYNNIQNIVISVYEKDNVTNSVVASIYLDGYENNILNSGKEGYIYILDSLSIEYIG